METKKSRSLVDEHPKGNKVLIRAEGKTPIISMTMNKEKVNAEYIFFVAGIGEFCVMDLELGQQVQLDKMARMDIDLQRVTIESNNQSYSAVVADIQEAAKHNPKLYEEKVKASEDAKFIEYYICHDHLINMTFPLGKVTK